jgi:PKD repeat protein
MKMIFSTSKIRQGITALVFIAAGLLMAGQAKASCKAGFTDSISGKTIKFFNSSSASNLKACKYTWSFGDGTTAKTTVTSAPSHTYADYNKTYTVCMYLFDSSAGCRDTICKTVTTGKAPCSVTVTYSVSLLSVSFSDSGSSAAVAGHKHSVYWDFGDGKTSTDAKVKHTYAKNGSYTACEIVYDSVTTCTAKACQTVSVSNCSLVVSYKYTVSGKAVSFTSTTTTSAHSSYKWSFGDGSKDSTSGSSVKHTYTASGSSFTTYLIVYDSSTGCTNYYVQTVVLCAVKTDFKSTSSLLDATFTSDSGNTSTVKYAWDFGDKGTSTSKNPKHSYSASGTYTVCLTVSDSAHGCYDKHCQTVTVSSCTLTDSYKYSVTGKKVSFSGTTNSTSTHIKYTWYFGDGAKDSSGKTVSHTYGSSVTSAVVYLLVYDSTTKCSNYFRETITFCNLHAGFSSSISTMTLKLLADSSGGSSAVKYTWALGDGSTATGKSVGYTYKKNGTYTVCLYVSDSATGCSASICKSVTINSCTLTTSYTYTVSGMKVSFSGTGSTTAHVRYLWYFGDGAKDSTTGKSVTHTYSSSTTTANAYLVLYDSVTKCTAYISHTILFCNVSAVWTYAASGKTVKFASSTSNTSTTKYKWSFGDGTYDTTSANPSHTYSATGKYYVCMVAIDGSCKADHCDSVSVTTGSSTYCIHGTVSTGKASGYPCIVYLIVYNSKDSSLKAIDSVTIKDTTGKYGFCGLSNGTYYTKAALLKKHPYYKYLVPTYHNDATKWAKAKSVVIYNGDVTGVDIKMVLGKNPGGAGFIGGKIKSGANKTGDPVANVLVVLYDSGANAVTSTYSDANGDYSFSGISFGTYNVEVEILGKPCTDAIVTISDTSATFKHVDMNINRLDITPAPAVLGINTNGWNITTADVYPNPVSSKLYIATNLQTSQNANIKIYDITGKVVTEINQDIAGGPQNMQVDASALPQGMYFIKLQLQKDNKILEARFVKVQ